MFRGDAAHLVDALVAASEWRPAAEGYSGYGRELQPWCPDDAFPMPVEALEAPRYSKYNNGGRSPDHKGKRASATPRGASPPVRRASLGDSSFACPSFAAAPKPEALPMPTSSLLTRALVRRSPSPPKMMAAAVAVMA